MRSCFKNFGWLLFIVVTIIVGCDNLITTKYLSSDIKEDSVNSLTAPVPDETEQMYQAPEESHIVIPNELKQEVSLILNENLSIKSVLCETSKRLNINFQMDPSIDSRIIFNAKDKPFIEILDAVCDMTDLRYTISNGLVKVEKDIPYSAMYDVQFLNISRDSENKISITTEVNSTSGNTTDGGANTAQTEGNVSVKAKSDFWEEFENGLKIIVGYGENEKQRYSVNKQSGIITVHANTKVQKSVGEYINKIKKSTMSQVLIEAKIIEVSLKNEYRRGINWGLLFDKASIKGGFFNNANNGISSIGAHGEEMTFAYTRRQLSSVVAALEEFGTTRTISNPRITAMNNQAAILKVAQNHVYFKLNYEKTYINDGNSRQEVAVSSDVKTVPLGFVMFVQPSIDLETGTITLFLRPTITKLASSVNDPAVNIAVKNGTNTEVKDEDRSRIPITEVREVASVLKLHDGEIAVLGGFMEVRSAKNKTGVPGYKNVPIFGELASSQGIGDEIIELVILIKVRLANTPKHQKAADIRLQRFVPDPRPFL
ncbi:MAG: hypothetical protein LBT03_01645 [Holosporales bacterium]|jgi:general secretion pathway protein D|nr:hypothetical protein [Holosporales bacterium]